MDPPMAAALDSNRDLRITTCDRDRLRRAAQTAVLMKPSRSMRRLIDGYRAGLEAGARR